MASSTSQVKVQASKSQSHKYSPVANMATSPLCDWPKCAPTDKSRVTSHTPRGRWLMTDKSGQPANICSIHRGKALQAGYKIDSAISKAISKASKAQASKASQPATSQPTSQPTVATSQPVSRVNSQSQPTVATVAQVKS